MSYKILINNWHRKAAEEEYFSKFIFEYLAFIAYLRTQLYQECHTDRRAVQKLKQDEQFKQNYLATIASASSLKKDWMKIKKELDKYPLWNASRDLNNIEENKWWNCQYQDIAQMTPQERSKEKGIISSLGDWQNMVEFWHSIRNNLFHGTKNPEDKRDRLLVKYGYKTLRKLVVIFLNEQD